MILFTAVAYQEMEENFARLTKEREEVIVRLQAAREMGDLSENGAYKYAKIELGSINRQLRELKYKLTNGQVVTPKPTYSIVEFGCQVKLRVGSETANY